MDEKAAQNFIQNIFATWINPEIEKRKTSAHLPEHFSLRKAQVIFLVDGNYIIRINEEVKLVILTNRGIAAEDQNFDEEGISLEGLELLKDEKDFGHVSIVRIRDLWAIAFDFRYGIQNSKKHFEVGRQFLETSEFCFQKENYQAMFVNLYLAAENLAKARILLYPDSEIRKTKKKGLVAAKVNVYSKETKMIEPEYRSTFNYLKKEYDKARYGTEFSLAEAEAERLLKTVQGFAQKISELYQQKLFFKD